jgi:hypothetical protein
MKKQTIITILVVALVITIGILGYKHYMNTTAPVVVPDSTEPEPSPTASSEPITIMEATIKEPNYTGTKPVIGGKGPLADAARAYVSESINAFATSADKEVPAMRKQYGNDAPPAHYTIDISAKKVESATTQSIVIDSYVYTGGANGNSLYKAYTATRTGTLLGIRDIVKSDVQNAFVATVKKQILADKTIGSAIFPDEITDLSMDSFANFSIDEKNLTIYFDKYQIGPGALGAVAFPLPLSSVAQFITLP